MGTFNTCTLPFNKYLDHNTQKTQCTMLNCGTRQCVFKPIVSILPRYRSFLCPGNTHTPTATQEFITLRLSGASTFTHLEPSFFEGVLDNCQQTCSAPFINNLPEYTVLILRTHNQRGIIQRKNEITCKYSKTWHTTISIIPKTVLKLYDTSL